MRLEELRERIKDEVVLREGEIRDHEWRQMGLIDETTKLGRPESDFGRLVQEESRKIDPYISRIASLKSRIKEAAELSDRRLTKEEIEQFVAEGERLQLSRTFIEKKWISQIISTIPLESLKNTPSEAQRLIRSTRPIPPAPSAPLKKPVTRPNKPKSEQIYTLPTPQERSVEKEYESNRNVKQGPSAGPAVSHQRVPNPFENGLPDTNRILGQAHNLVQNHSATRTIGTLLALSKRSLSDVELWNNVLNKTIRWTAVFFGAVWKVLVFLLVTVFNTVVRLGRLLGDREFWRITGAVARVVIVVAIGWKLWSWYDDWSSKKTLIKPVVEVAPKDPSITSGPKKGSGKGKIKSGEATTDAAITKPNQPAINGQAVPNVVSDSARSSIVEQPTPPNITASIATVSKDYDEIIGEPGQYGERQAKKGKSWGLWSDKDGKWLIEPVYNDIGVFKNGKAAVSLNGQDYDIDRNDQRVLN